MTELGRTGDVQEIEVTDESLVGCTIRDVDRDLPNACIIGLVTRADENAIPEPDFELEYGGHLTVLGRSEAVTEAIRMLHPHD